MPAFRIIFLSCFLLVYGNSHSQITALIKDGKPVIADGMVSENEWSEAMRYTLCNGGTVSLKADGSHYNILIQAHMYGWSHIYILHNDTLHIFHASAALGSATYVKGTDKLWNPVKDFSWQLRDTSNSAEAEAERKMFLEKEGWLANINRRGAEGVMEYIISQKRFPRGKFNFAIVFADMKDNTYYWPEQINDNAVMPELLRGNTPSGLKFDFSKWAAVNKGEL